MHIGNKRKKQCHLRKRKPKRQGSRSQTGKLLPVRLPDNRMAGRLAWRKRQNKRKDG